MTACSRCSRSRCPTPGAGEVLVEIVALRHLRHRPAPRPRAASPGPDPCSATSGRARSPRSATDVDGLGVGARVVCGADPGLRRVPGVRRGRPSVCLRRAARPPRLLAGAFARYKSWRRPIDCCGVPRRCRSARPRSPSRPRSRSTRSTLSGVDARRPRARDRRRPRRAARHRRAARAGRATTSPCRSPRRCDGSARSPVGAARVVVSPRTLPTPPMGAPVRRAVHGRVRVLGQRGARPRRRSTSSTSPARACSSAPATSCPGVNHNRVIVLELTIIGAYNYDAGGFAPALELLASGAMPLDVLIEPSTCSSTGCCRAMQRLAAGELPGKVMVRPADRIDRRMTAMSEPSSCPDSTTWRSRMDPEVLDEHGPRRDPGLLRRRVRLDRGRQHGEPGNPLILYTGEFVQFVYLLPGDPDAGVPDPRPLRAPGVDARGARGDRRQGQGVAGEGRPRAQIIDVKARHATGRAASTCSRVRTSGSCCR